MNIPPIVAPPPLPRKKRRWWLYLLIGFGGLIMLAVVGFVLLAGYWNSLVKNYTTTAAHPLPKVQNDPERRKELEKHWEQFVQAIIDRENPPPYKISADDINQLLAQHGPVGEYVHFVIRTNHLQADFSAPLDKLNRKELKGRYLNGTANINIIFQDGWLTVNLGNVEANGKPFPGWPLRQFQGKNLVKFLDDNHDVVNALHELESLEVKDGFIVLTPRKPER